MEFCLVSAMFFKISQHVKMCINYSSCNCLESLKSKRYLEVQRGPHDCQRKVWPPLKWNPTVCLSCPSLPAAAEERLPHPLWAASLWPLVLIVCTERERERGERWREGEMGDGLYSITLGGGLRGHHHQAAADSSYHAWAALWRAAAGWEGGRGLRRGGATGERNVHPQQNW